MRHIKGVTVAASSAIRNVPFIEPPAVMWLENVIHKWRVVSFSLTTHSLRNRSPVTTDGANVGHLTPQI